MSPSSSSMILMAGSALLVAAAATQLFPSSSSSRELGDIDDEEDVITEDDVCKIFDRLFMEMQQVLAQLSQQVQQIQMSGQHIPEAQLRKLLKAEYERALMAKQTQIFDAFGVDEDCLEEAVWEFLADGETYAKAVRSVERFQKLYENVSGESVVGRRPGKEPVQEDVETLSPERTVEVAEIYFGALTETMKGLVESFKMQGKDFNDRMVVQELQMQFASVANDAGDEALGGIGISGKTFQASIEKNASNPDVARKLTMLQMKQQQDLIAMGVPTM